ncbi:MAG: serine protease AprX [Actinomycetota bacterium]|nr:serine protease AprX [Actinomycetota bacterium]
MSIVFGVSWNDSKKGRFLGGALAALLAFTLMGPQAAQTMSQTAGRMVSVIVRELPGSGSAPERAVESLGGKVGRHINIIHGFVAELPAASIRSLAMMAPVHSVTPNRPVHMLSMIDGFDGFTDPGSMYNVQNAIKSRDSFGKGITGKGVDIALIDTGLVPVNGFTTAGKVVNGPDLSFESQVDQLRYSDTNGHGTHIGGIIAGRDDAIGTITGSHKGDADDFMGVAPDARLINLKVGNAVGGTDVSQVLAAIDWVVQHRNDSGLNIRVLNLSFGTDSSQDYRIDPLAYAAEVAWRKGIVVVAAAGNSGFGDAKLNDPAYDPYVIAVGAADTKATPYDTSDDQVPGWSSRGDGVRNPDFVAPGKSVVSLRDVNSHIDLTHPEGRVNTRFFRGSGTSQAAAVTSGAAALLLQQRPNLTPDQVKRIFSVTASTIPSADAQAQGAGMIDVRAALKMSPPNFTQNWDRSTGLGSLEASRGSLHVEYNGVQLTGEQDIMGNAWNGAGWSAAMWAGAGWSGGNWNGAGWSGAGWSGAGWSGAGWSGAGWSGAGWSGAGWSGAGWSGAGWQ